MQKAANVSKADFIIQFIIFTHSLLQNALQTQIALITWHVEKMEIVLTHVPIVQLMLTVRQAITQASVLASQAMKAAKLVSKVNFIILIILPHPIFQNA